MILCRRLLIADGRLTFLGMLVLGSIGAGLFFGTLFFVSSLWLAVITLPAGICLIGVAGIAARAQVLGIKPFTTDPLGWRKAKKTYAESDEPKPDEDKRT